MKIYYRVEFNTMFNFKFYSYVFFYLGLSLTIQDIGVPEINLHGPVGTVS